MTKAAGWLRYATGSGQKVVYQNESYTIKEYRDIMEKHCLEKIREGLLPYLDDVCHLDIGQHASSKEYLIRVEVKKAPPIMASIMFVEEPSTTYSKPLRAARITVISVTFTGSFRRSYNFDFENLQLSQVQLKKLGEGLRRYFGNIVEGIESKNTKEKLMTKTAQEIVEVLNSSPFGFSASVVRKFSRVYIEEDYLKKHGVQLVVNGPETVLARIDVVARKGNVDTVIQRLIQLLHAMKQRG